MSSSFTLFALKVVAPALAKSLVKAFKIPSDVQNELWGALIDAAAGEVLVSRGSERAWRKPLTKWRRRWQPMSSIPLPKSL